MSQRLPEFQRMQKLIHGFSLLEMALALVILSMMMGWLMTPLRVQNGLHKYQQTDQRLTQAQQALLGHAIIYHYLPCPDTDQPPRQPSDTFTFAP